MIRFRRCCPIFLSAVAGLALNAKNLMISPSTLPDGTVNVSYSQDLKADGCGKNCTWSLSGTLPPGLSLGRDSGAIGGTPTTAGRFDFTVTATADKSTTGSQSYSVTIAAATPPRVPTPSLSGIPGSANSGQQFPFDLVLSSSATQAISGQVTLSFQPDSMVSTDDPAIQFSNGSRTVPFSIPAGATKAVFAVNPTALQTGTGAGTITVAVSSNLVGGNVSQKLVVGRAAPVIQSATVSRTSSGFQVQVAGFSNTRDLSAALFHFIGVAAQMVQTSDLSVNLATQASQWYSGSSSAQFGGQFLLVVPFTVSRGAATGLSTVSVQLQNGQSTSATVTTNF
jgi:hypothetical protein